MQLATNFFKCDDYSSFSPPFSDTLYQIDKSLNIRKTYFEQGKLKLPNKLLYDNAAFGKKFQSYIFNLMIYPAYKDNLFMTYYYKGKPNIGICNLEKESLQMINLNGRKESN